LPVMKILLVCPYDLSIPGGVQAHIAHLATHLEHLGHKVAIISPRLKKKGYVHSISVPVEHITDSRRMALWGTNIDISWLNRYERSDFKSLLSEFEPDIIHFHTIWNPFMQFQMKLMVPKSVKSVATFHDTPPDHGVGKIVGGTIMKLAARMVIRTLDAAISVSKSQMKAMGFTEKNKPSNLVRIPNGIDFSVHYSVNPSLLTDDSDSEAFQLIFVGRLEERKGILHLLDALELLKKDKDVPPVTLTIVGNGPLMGKVKARISNRDLSTVRIFDNCDDEEKNNLIARSDLMVAPALYGESFGIVLLEAMALGVKVVGFGNEGYLNIGRQYDEQQFPPPGDTKALAEVIKRHILNPESTDHLIEKGLQIAEKHDWGRIAGEIEEVYEGVVEGDVSG